MRIVFKKIPRLAIYFYSAGFFIISVALFLYFNPSVSSQFVALIHIQQLFIVGAIVVALGSVINNLSQFKKDKK